MVHTDGLTIKLPKIYYDKYMEICKKWEAKTKLFLEHVQYKKMVIRDVNSYLSETTEGKIKYKGTFVPHDVMIANDEYHKAFNQGIIPIALSDYYIKGIPVEDTIHSHKNIYDFCKTFNATKGWTCETVFVNEIGDEFDVMEQQKNNRYYISKNGRLFRKCHLDGRVNKIEAEDYVVIFNKFEEKRFHEYQVDYDYYIKECYKIIDTISGKKEQLAIEKKEQREAEKLRRETENYLKFCVDKIPTQRQYDLYKKDYLIEKYGEPPVIKTGNKTKDLEQAGQMAMFAEMIEGSGI